MTNTNTTSTGVGETIMSAQELRESAVRSGISHLLECCSANEVAGFHRIHDNAPWKGAENIPAAKLDESYELVRRTVLAGRAALQSGEQP